MSRNVPMAVLGWLVFALACDVGYAGYRIVAHLFMGSPL